MKKPEGTEPDRIRIRFGDEQESGQRNEKGDPVLLSDRKETKNRLKQELYNMLAHIPAGSFPGEL